MQKRRQLPWMKKEILRLLLIAKLLLLTLASLSANMAEPVDHGTYFSTPFTAEFVDVVREDIHVKIDSTFSFAQYTITYYLESDSTGLQVPLLFYASDIVDSLRVTHNGQRVALTQVPSSLHGAGKEGFQSFERYFSTGSRDLLSTSFPYREEGFGFVVNPEDFRYFAVDLSSGKHQITVTYTASAWKDGWDWVNEYTFRYALAPAKYWRSFGQLNVTVDATDFTSVLSINLAKTDKSFQKEIHSWHFSELPAEVFLLQYDPPVSFLAKALIWISPLGVAIFFLAICLVLQLKLVSQVNRWGNIVLVILLPLIGIMAFWFAFGLIDWSIGEEAAGNHGYIFFAIVAYPVILLIYYTFLQIGFKILDRKVKSA